LHHIFRIVRAGGKCAIIVIEAIGIRSDRRRATEGSQKGLGCAIEAAVGRHVVGFSHSIGALPEATVPNMRVDMPISSDFVKFLFFPFKGCDAISARSIRRRGGAASARIGFLKSFAATLW
jgi:hypothetical protein